MVSSEANSEDQEGGPFFPQEAGSPSQMPQETHNPFSWHMGILENERNRNLRWYHNLVIVIQWLSCVWLFATPWTAAPQASLSITNSQGLLSNSGPWSEWCHPTILSSVVPLSFCLQSFPASGSFPMNQFFTSGGQSIKEFQLQHRSFQWIFRTDFL